MVGIVLQGQLDSDLVIGQEGEGSVHRRRLTIRPAEASQPLNGASVRSGEGAEQRQIMLLVFLTEVQAADVEAQALAILVHFHGGVQVTVQSPIFDESLYICCDIIHIVSVMGR